jgi:hypothetical protein
MNFPLNGINKVHVKLPSKLAKQSACIHHAAKYEKNFYLIYVPSASAGIFNSL